MPKGISDENFVDLHMHPVAFISAATEETGIGRAMTLAADLATAQSRETGESREAILLNWFITASYLLGTQTPIVLAERKPNG